MWKSCSNQRKDEMENPNHQVSDLGKLVKRINFATQENLEEKFEFLIKKIDGEKKKEKLMLNTLMLIISRSKYSQ